MTDWVDGFLDRCMCTAHMTAAMHQEGNQHFSHLPTPITREQVVVIYGALHEQYGESEELSADQEVGA